MQESHGEGVATHTDPESCGVARKGSVEALTGARTGWALSRESSTAGAGKPLWFLRDADAVRKSGRPHLGHRYRKMFQGPARSETPSMCGNTSRENREIPCLPTADGAAGRIAKSKDTRR